MPAASDSEAKNKPTTKSKGKMRFVPVAPAVANRHRVNKTAAMQEVRISLAIFAFLCLILFRMRATLRRARRQLAPRARYAFLCLLCLVY